MLSLLALVEPSKVPWFIAGGVLAAWAVVLSAIGLTRPDFPSNDGGTRLVILVSVVLVVAAMTSAVASS
jgi:glucan phosphoethanolaminetransferase (alkaline phosphatase superfamily)